MYRDFEEFARMTPGQLLSNRYPDRPASQNPDHFSKTRERKCRMLDA
jgi:hypothetical protein